MVHDNFRFFQTERFGDFESITELHILALTISALDLLITIALAHCASKSIERLYVLRDDPRPVARRPPAARSTARPVPRRASRCRVVAGPPESSCAASGHTRTPVRGGSIVWAPSTEVCKMPVGASAYRELAIGMLASAGVMMVIGIPVLAVGIHRRKAQRTVVHIFGATHAGLALRGRI